MIVLISNTIIDFLIERETAIQAGTIYLMVTNIYT